MHHDDPRLTAYALGELEPPERAEVEALLQNDPTAAQEVEEMRELAALVRRHLSTEEAPPLAPQQRDDILTELKEPRVVMMPRNQATASRRRAWMPVAIAACAAVLAGSGVLYYEEHKPRTTLALPQSKAATEAQSGAFFAAEPAGNNVPAEPAPTAGFSDLALAPDAPASPVPLAFSDRAGQETQLRRAAAPQAAPGIIKENEGTLRLSSNNTYAGTTTITDGTLQTAKKAAAPAPAPLPSPAMSGRFGGSEAASASGALSPAPRPDLNAADKRTLRDAAPPSNSARQLADKQTAHEETAESVPLPSKPGGLASAANGRPAAESASAVPPLISRNEGSLKKAQAAGPLASAADKRQDTAPRPTAKGEAAGVAIDQPVASSPAPAAPFAPVAPSAAAPVAKPDTRKALDTIVTATKATKDLERAKMQVTAATPSPLTAQSAKAALGSSRAPAEAKNSPVDFGGSPALPGDPVPPRGAPLFAQSDRKAGAAQSSDLAPDFSHGIRSDGLKPDFDTGLSGYADGGYFNKADTKSAQPVDESKAKANLGSWGLAPIKDRLALVTADEVRDNVGQEGINKRLERFEALPKLQEQPAADKPNTDSYDSVTDNPFLQVLVRGNETSTFSIDVDTASYSNVRRMLMAGERPPKGAVRIEELVNYFKYDYPEPKAGDPMAVSMDVSGCPWTPEHRLLRVGLKARELDPETRQDANLIFLLDVSGSMAPENRLPLIKKSLRLLVEKLGTNDTVGIVVYAGASGVALQPTNDKDAILAALNKLEAGGSTNGAAGIQLAYELAAKRFQKGRINRVILATDGDFNVGVTNQSDLIDLIKKKAASGVYLTILGVGHGNLKDSTMEKLADQGNGNYAYIDTIAEGRKVLVEQMAGTLVTVAKDVKVQIEFNPAQVGAYRLIGYEKRLLAREDFNDDSKDAGEIGAGHTVTALYELIPAGQPIPGERETTQVDPLKYQPNPALPGNKLAQASVDAPRYSSGRGKAAELADTTVPVNELLTLKLRWKAPDGDVSTKREFPLTDAGLPLDQSAKDFRWAAAVAEFGMMLRDSPYKGQATWSGLRELALQGQGKDADSHRIEFLDLIEKAEAVVGR